MSVTDEVHIYNRHDKKKEECIFFITKKLPVASQQCLLDLQKKKKSKNILLVYKTYLSRFKIQHCLLCTEHFTTL